MHTQLSSFRNIDRVVRCILLAWVMIAGFGCARSMSPAAQSAAEIENRGVPAELQVRGAILLRVHATGFQIYSARKDAAGAIAWKLKAPDATFNAPDGSVGRHYAGPTWELTGDGSKVVGLKLAEHASDDRSAIAWLLLAAKSHEGTGILSTVTFIQRINTAGGKSPATNDAREGDEVKIPYSADYIFYGPGTSTQPAGN